MNAAPSPSREQQFFDALKRITQFASPERIRREAEKTYGLSAEEALEYAYDNVRAAAAAAIHGVRRPKK